MEKHNSTETVKNQFKWCVHYVFKSATLTIKSIVFYCYLLEVMK